MPSGKENLVLKPSEYKINGNSIRAFYDNQGKLVFVLDLNLSETKPNVLLVMASRGNRKWDDVLANDYGLDLELVRPKKDNKYQKLDVEYDGLAVYDNLIRAYENGDNLKKFLSDLSEFRVIAVRNSATERLQAARAVADNARETIERTGDTIVELQSKIKAVRSKISGLRRGIGREPTKESAAKILKVEAQLDALNAKLTRAQKRLENANKRLLTAQSDIDAAQSVLDLLPGVADDTKFKTVGAPIVAPRAVTRDDDDTDDDDNADVADDEIADDIDADDDSESSDVKPLFDKDPNILNEKIAFKPIDFDLPSDMKNTDDAETIVDDASDMSEELDNVSAPDVDADDNTQTNAPAIAFEPPRAIMDAVNIPDGYDNADSDVKLDDVYSDAETDVNYDLDAPTSIMDDDTHSDVDKNAEYQAPQNTPVLDSLKNVDNVPVADETVDYNDVPVLETDAKENEIVAADNPLSGNNTNNVVAPAPVPGDVSNMVRPVAPGTHQNVMTDIPKQSGTVQRKPGLLYYVLLLVLIALSVFTLWLYQRSNVSNDVVPTLVVENVKTPEVPVVADAPDVTDNENPFVAEGDDAPGLRQPVMEQVVQDSLDKIADAADVPVSHNDEPQPYEEDVAAKQDTDVAPEPVTPVVVNKPEYKVSQENVFTNGDMGGGNLCAGDIAPDANGCCPGETYSTVNGQKVCCPDDGTDCFPPMF